MPNASDGMRQLFASFPGFGDTFAAMMDQLSQSRTPMLRSHTQTFVPVLAQLSAFMQAQGQQLPGGFDGNPPLGESNTELVEISDAPVDDSLFEIPSDYRATSLPDLMKALHPNLSTPGLPGRTIPSVP